MTMDFDRYLLNTDSYLKTLGLGIHKAYVEWSSYSYLAGSVYSMCSGSDSSGESGSRSSEPGNSKHFSSQFPKGSGSCCYRRSSCQEVFEPAIDLFSGAPTNTYNTCAPVHQVSNKAYNDVTASERLHNQQLPASGHISSPRQPEAIKKSAAFEIIAPEEPPHWEQEEWPYSNNNNYLTENNREMPRPPGNQFGSRLGWVRNNNNNNNPELHCLTSTPSRPKTTPVLGVSGLNFHDHGGRSTPTRRKLTRSIEVFQECVTNQRYPATSPSSHKERYNQHGHGNGVNNRPKIPSPISLTPFSDVIEEISSEDDVSSDNNDVDVVPEESSSKTSSRKVSFADEQGHSLVACRLFDPDSDYRSSSGDESSDSEDESDDVSVGQVLTSEDRMRRVSLFASRTYRRINTDIEKVKQLIAQNRDYFESLRPVHLKDGAKSTITSANQEDCDNSKKMTDVTNSSTAQTETISGSNMDGCPRDQVTAPVIDPAKAAILCDHDCDNIVRLHFAHHEKEDNVMHGEIRVRNLCFRKNVHLRYTMDNWKTYADVNARYCQSHACPCACSTPHETDIFNFAFQVGRSNETDHPQNSSTLEFAICFDALDINARFWDSNSGGNYRLQLY